MSATDKFVQMFIAIFAFVAVMGLVLFLADRVRSRKGEVLQTIAFVLPAALLISVGLLYPGIRTIFESFKNAAGTEYVGIDNYTEIFTTSGLLTVLRNTAIWVIVTPIVATLIGLVYAVLIDKARIEAVAKALIFLPMAISLVGASIIWKFVYDYRSTENVQIGLANQILKSLGLDTYRFLLTEPWNTFFLIVIMIWVQAGFAMTILSASIKAIPDDIVEAARLDGVSGFRMFRYITVPSIRPALIVVLTAISITTLNEFYTQSFRSFNNGLGAALAVLLFILVIPIVVYNIRQMRKLEAR